MHYNRGHEVHFGEYGDESNSECGTYLVRGMEDFTNDWARVTCPACLTCQLTKITEALRRVRE